MNSDYPVRFDVDYPDRDLDRASTFFRLLFLIPIAILVELLGGGTFSADSGDGLAIAGSFAGFTVIPAALMILFREKYPRWWFDWNLQLARLTNRVNIYGALLDDQYPSTDEEQSVHLDIDYPDVENDLGRGMPLIKWLLAIPHYLVVVVLAIAAFFAVIGAWFAILFTGRYPRGLFDFVVGVHRWANRVGGYAFMMVTDKYPPFSLEP